MESTHQFSSRPDCNNTAEVPSLLCALLSQQSHLFPICLVLTYNDSRKDLHKLCQIPCAEEGLVSGVHTLLGRVLQVCHRPHKGEDVEKGRKVEQEVEKEDQVEETAHMDDYGDEVKGANMLSLSHGACVCRWNEDEVPRKHGPVSCCVAHSQIFHFCDFYFVPKFSLLSCCINSSSLFPEVNLCTLLHLENTSFEVWYSHPHRLQQTAVSCKRSICNKVNEFKKIVPWRIVPNTRITSRFVQSVLGSSPWWLS